MGKRGWWLLAVGLWALGGFGWWFALSNRENNATPSVVARVFEPGTSVVTPHDIPVAPVEPVLPVSMSAQRKVRLPPDVRCVGGFQVRVSLRAGVTVFEQVLSAGKPGTCDP